MSDEKSKKKMSNINEEDEEYHKGKLNSVKRILFNISNLF